MACSSCPSPSAGHQSQRGACWSTQVSNSFGVWVAPGLLLFEEQVAHLPELALQSRRLGDLRRQLGFVVRIQRKVAKNNPDVLGMPSFKKIIDKARC